MTSNGSPGFVRRSLDACKRALLGKSGRVFLEQHLNGNNEYWDRAAAAQLGWPQKPPPKQDAG
ncbi:MAG TPA: hypothetical protein VK395_33575 [Gemmataceae bacterium]|nr:hypothetical protein [Gemmataceae bacterium]